MTYLGSDHGGFKLKEQLKGYLDELGHKWQDMGNTKLDTEDDYPVFAKAVAEAVAQNPTKHLGILLCRTGAGVTIVADKFKGIRAALGITPEQIAKIRGDEQANVLTIASDYTSFDDLKTIVKTFIDTPFSGEPRHVRRLEEMDQIEEENFK